LFEGLDVASARQEGEHDGAAHGADVVPHLGSVKTRERGERFTRRATPASRALCSQPERREPMRRLVLVAFLAACGGAQPPPIEGVELRGNRIILSDRVLFEHNSERILEESHPVLDRVVSLLDAHDEVVRVQVQGHSSTDGSARRNEELSTARAASVATYLREHGVRQEVTSQGYGPTYPLCREDTAECHEQNRRVEFFVDMR
jgi:outer membrane protein OmpA-like peptidoglycan-associated protein